MAALSFSSADDGKWVYEATARLGFAQFAELQITDQQFVPEPHSVFGVANSQVVWIRELPLCVSQEKETR